MPTPPLNEAYQTNLNEILGLIIRSNNYVSGMSLQDFIEDEKTNFAVSHCLYLISLKAGVISRLNRFNRDFPSGFKFPFRELASIERHLKQKYQQLPPRVIWNTVERDLEQIERLVRQALGDGISEDLPKREYKFPKIQLYFGEEENHRDLTSELLVEEITPFINALTELQHVVDYIAGEQESIVHVQYIGQNSPVGIQLNGVAEAFKIFIETIVPWRRKHAKRMAELEYKSKQAEIDLQYAETDWKYAEVIEKRANTQKLSMEADEIRINLVLKVIESQNNNLSNTQTVALINRLMESVTTLTDSLITVSLPDNPRE